MITINDPRTWMCSDISDRIAVLLPEGWVVSWLSERTLSRSQAETAMTIAELAVKGGFAYAADAYAEELGLTGAEALRLAGAHPLEPDVRTLFAVRYTGWDEAGDLAVLTRVTEVDTHDAALRACAGQRTYQERHKDLLPVDARIVTCTVTTTPWLPDLVTAAHWPQERTDGSGGEPDVHTACSRCGVAWPCPPAEAAGLADPAPLPGLFSAEPLF